MKLVRRCLLLWLLLWFCPVACQAAGSAGRAFQAAARAFNDNVWDRAELLFSQFVTNYPKSDRVPEAILRQAQAQYRQAERLLQQEQIPQSRTKSQQAISLLTTQQSRAGRWADEYLYWTGEAYFQSSNFLSADETFNELTREFPKSPRRVAANVGEAASRVKLGEWSRAAALLQDQNSALQVALRANATNEWVVSGCVLLAEAELARANYASAKAALLPLDHFRLKPEQDWQRVYLQCRIDLAWDRTAESLARGSNLIALAMAAARPDLRAESVAFQAHILEKLGRADAAIAVWNQNISMNAPADRQREALVKMTDLAIAQGRFSDATATLEQFLQQVPPPAAADIALLTLGELYLKHYLAGSGDTNAPAGTNLLSEGIKALDRLRDGFPSSPLVGKAELDRGWCLWYAGRSPESLDAFQAAANRLGSSEDLAIARFKLGDALFLANDYQAALPSYRAALEELSRWPEAKTRWGADLLYQIMRASLGLGNLLDARLAIEQMMASFPDSTNLDQSLLLLGQAFADNNEPKLARSWLEQLIQLRPSSPLVPEAELDIARARELDLTGADKDFASWLAKYPTNLLRPTLEYWQALMHLEAGDETNALTQLTNIVARFPSNSVALLAQWQVADVYFARKDYVSAEKNYRALWQNPWGGNKLALEACMMAGRAALSQPNYQAAAEYFTNLTSRPLEVAPELSAQAMFAYGDVLMLREPEGTNKSKVPDLEEAVRVFGKICQLYTNEPSALARGEIGNCYLQLAASDPRYYDLASNSYQMVMSHPCAGVATRSGAQVGLGQVLEKEAPRASGEQSIRLLKLARADYLDVFHQNNLRPGEVSDAWWVEEAGLNAARVSESLGDWTQAVSFYRRLEQLTPNKKDILEKKIVRAQEHL